MNTGTEPVRVQARPAHHAWPGASATHRVRARGQRVHRRRRRAVAARRPRAHQVRRRRSRRSRARWRARATWCSCRRWPGSARRTGIRTRAGSSTGITRDTTEAHLARATLEGIAFQVADLAPGDGGGHGASADRSARRRRCEPERAADAVPGRLCSASVVDRPSSVETTALGAAYLAGLAAGVFAESRGDRARTPRLTGATNLL